MKQLKIVLERLKKPSVIASVGSQIVTLLLLYNIKVDMNIVTGTISAICSILILLGILSNPSSGSKGYGDDIFVCNNCNKLSEHVIVNGKMMCKECGCVYKGNGKCE